MVRICSLEQYSLYHHKLTKTGEAIAVKKENQHVKFTLREILLIYVRGNVNDGK